MLCLFELAPRYADLSSEGHELDPSGHLMLRLNIRRIFRKASQLLSLQDGLRLTARPIRTPKLGLERVSDVSGTFTKYETTHIWHQR